MATAQLRLVQDAPIPKPGASSDPVRQVFEHWVFVMGKSPARCKLDTARRSALAAALTLHDVETLMLAVEGMAASAWCAAHREFDLAHLVAKSALIEKYADEGEAARLRAQQEEAASLQSAQSQLAAQEPADPVAAAAARDRYRALLARMRNV